MMCCAQSERRMLLAFVEDEALDTDASDVMFVAVLVCPLVHQLWVKELIAVLW